MLSSCRNFRYDIKILIIKSGCAELIGTVLGLQSGGDQTLCVGVLVCTDGWLVLLWERVYYRVLVMCHCFTTKVAPTLWHNYPTDETNPYWHCNVLLVSITCVLSLYSGGVLYILYSTVILLSLHCKDDISCDVLMALS